jgi:hypothetical protein
VFIIAVHVPAFNPRAICHVVSGLGGATVDTVAGVVGDAVAVAVVVGAPVAVAVDVATAVSVAVGGVTVGSCTGLLSDELHAGSATMMTSDWAKRRRGA